MPPTVFQRVLRAATRPAQIGVLAGGTAAAGIAAAMGAALGNPAPAFAIAVLTAFGFAATTAWDALYNPIVRRDGPRIADNAIRERLLAVEEAAAAVRAALADRDGAAAWFAEVDGACRALVENAERLAVQGDGLCELRAATPLAELKAEREDLRRRAARTDDKQIAAQWKEASRRKDAQLRHLAGIDDTLERIHAELATVEGALGELHARILRMDTSGAVDGEDVGVSTRETLRALDEEIGSVERAAAATLKEMGR